MAPGAKSPAGLVGDSEAVVDLTRGCAARIQRVLADELFLVVFQPMIDVRTATIVAYEALTRFPVEPVRGPRSWFADAASVGLGGDLELATALQAIDSIANDDVVPAVGPALVTINVSASTMLAATGKQLLDVLVPDRFALELTGEPGTDWRRVAQVLAPHRAAGLRVAVDELIGGAIELARLFELAPDIVKIDGAVVARIDEDAVARSMVKEALRVLRGDGSRDVRVVASNVERRAQLDTLALIGVDWAQGYHLGRPAHLRRELHRASQHPGHP